MGELVMNYKNATREELIEKIKEQETQLKQIHIVKEQEEKLDYFWTGNLGHWTWDVKENRTKFNPLKVTALGYKIEELPEKIEIEFFTKKLHPDDYEKNLKALKDLIEGDSPIYEMEYRIRTKDRKWKWFYDRGRIFKRNENGKPEVISGITIDITEKKELLLKLEDKNKLLEIQVMSDGLTNLLSHNTVFSKLEEEVSRSKRYNMDITILLLDIDHLKIINEKFGHQMGDQVLQNIAKKIKENIREVDIAGRYGGEEFLIFFPNTGIENAFIVAERLRVQIEQMDIDEGIKLSISGGIKEYRGESALSFIEEAENMLHRAKSEGGNKVFGLY